jgi:hypothetical protein
MIHPPVVPSDAFMTLESPSAAHVELCTNDGHHPNFPNDADIVTKMFCADLSPGVRAPVIHGLADLQKQLGLEFTDPNGANGGDGNPGFAILGASSSLVGRLVSAINPRAMIFTPPPPDRTKPKGYVVLTFTRGEQFVEVAAHDPIADALNFYLVRFQQTCSSTAVGCTFGDLLTPNIEKNWTGVSVYESSGALNNTIFDCLECHQPDTSGPKILRMPESTAPFTHFFSSATEGGRALLADFHAAHGDVEDYGPVPASMIDKSDPALLRSLIEAAGFAAQPNAFDCAKIETEVKASNPMEPSLNDPPGSSGTWEAMYERSIAGDFIAAPYHDVKVTDARKLAEMTKAYQDVMAGRTPPAMLPDIRDVFLDDGLRDMGFAPKVGLDGRALLKAMCQQCHNSHLDQSLSRAHFDVEMLESMAPMEKMKAVSRMMKDDTVRQKMPPALFRTITDDERQRMIDAINAL